MNLRTKETALRRELDRTRTKRKLAGKNSPDAPHFQSESFETFTEIMAAPTTVNNTLRSINTAFEAIPGQLNNVIKNIPDPTVIDNAFRSLDSAFNYIPGKLGTLVDSIDEILKQIGSFFNTTSSLLKDVNVTSLALSFWCLYQAYITKSWTIFALDLWVLAREFKIPVRNLLSLIFGPDSEKVLNDDDSAKAEGFETLTAHLTGSPIQAVGAFIMGFIATLAGANSASYGWFANHLTIFGRASIGFKNLRDMMNHILEFSTDCYNRFIHGKSSEQLQWEQAFPKLISVETRYRLATSNDFKRDYLQHNAKLCTAVVDLMTDIDEIKASCIRSKDPNAHKLMTLLNSYAIRLAPTYELAVGSPVYSHKDRIAPGTLYLYGASGVGKSNLVKYLGARIYAKYYSKQKKFTPNTIIHERVSTNEFWDGYINNPVTYYDDMLQTKDSTSRPNVEIMEFIRACNEAPYQLHMSDIKDKKNTFFTSQFIFASSNVKQPQPVSIADKAAFWRRWDLSVEVSIADAFAKKDKKDNNVIDKAKVRRHLESIKAAGGSPQAFLKDMYVLKPYEMSTGSALADSSGSPSTMTLTEFENLFFEMYDAKARNSTDLSLSMLEQAGVFTPPSATDCDAFVDKFLAQALDTLLEEPEKTDFVDALSSIPEDPPQIIDDNLDDTDDDEPITGKLELKYAPATPMPEPDGLYSKAETLLAQACFSLTTSTEPTCLSDIKFTEPKKQPWKTLLIKTRRTAATAVTGIWDGLQSLFRRVLNDTQQFFLALYESAKKNWKLIAGIAFFSTASAMFAYQFRKCSLSKFNSFDDIGQVQKCVRPCKVCKTFIAVHPLDTVEYRRSVLEHLIDHPELESERPHFLAMFYANRTTIQEAGIIHAIKEKALFVNDIKDAVGQYNYPTTSKAPTKAKAEYNYVTTTKSTTKPGHAEMDDVSTEQPITSPGHIYRLESGFLRNIAKRGDLVQLEQHQSVVLRNSVFVSGDTGPRYFGMGGVFITGRILLVPNHFVTTLKALKLDYFTISNVGADRGTKVRMDSCRFHQLTDLSTKPMDLCFVVCPDNIPSRPRILSKFILADHSSRLTEGGFVLAGIRKVNDNQVMYSCMSNNIQKIATFAYNTTRDGTLTANNCVTYLVGTKAGDCGSLLFANNKTIPSKIFGFHIAGRDGQGVALVLSQELLSRNLNEMEGLNSRALIDGRIPFTMQMKTPEFTTDATLSTSLTNVGNCLSLGLFEQSSSPNTTNIIPSLISGCIQEPITKPAYLRNVTVDGEVVNPMQKGIKKVLNSPDPLDPKLVKICIEDIKNIHMKNRPAHRPILTLDEAVKGIEGEYDAVNRSSSAGYPYNLSHANGKRPWLGTDEYIITDEVRADVAELLRRCKNNERGDVVWLASLKDERRPIPKVNEGKTRVFAAGPMHYTLLVRQYFLAFAQHVMDNRLINECGVGINVHSHEWTLLADLLRTMGEKVMAGDFSNFDGSLLAEILWLLLDLINEWYDDGPENAQIRRALFEDIVNANILVLNELIRCTHSQPSGNPLTVIINCLFNQFIMRYAYCACMLLEKMRDPSFELKYQFSKDVYMICYGDDNVLNISDRIISWFNQRLISQVMSTFGMTYTDESKSGDSPDYRKLSEVSFLKRKFVAAYDRVIAPLDLETCYEMANWVKGKEHARRAATIENAENSLTELFWHGEFRFEHARKVYADRLRALGVDTDFPSFAALELEYLMDNFSQTHTASAQISQNCASMTSVVAS